MELEAWHDALRKGLGRALQHVGEMDVAAVRPLILHSCLHNISYDHQMEERSSWMAEMLLASGDAAWFVPQILAGLDGLQDCYDAEQALRILARLVLAGHEELRPRVHEAFRAIHSAQLLEIWTGRDALVLMDGVAALLPVAQAAGQRLLADPEEWKGEGFFLWMEGLLDAAQVRAHLEAAARTDASVAELLARIAENARRPSKTSDVPPTRAALEALVADTSRRDDLRLAPLAAAGRRMLDADAVYFLHRLDIESDPARIERLLFLLRSGPHPAASDRVLELARGPDPDLQPVALELLHLSGDRRGPQLARELLQADLRALEQGVVPVLGRACTAEDVPSILRAVSVVSDAFVDADGVQSVVRDLLALRGAAAGARLADIFVWVYERAFCGHCRAEAVEALVEISALDAGRREECRFDAFEDVRAAAR